MQKNLLTKLRTLAEFIIGFCLGYYAFSIPFSNPLINIVLIVLSIFVLFEGLGGVDELNGFGQANKKDDHHNDSHPNSPMNNTPES